MRIEKLKLRMKGQFVSELRHAVLIVCALCCFCPELLAQVLLPPVVADPEEVDTLAIVPREGKYALVRPSKGEVIALGDTILQKTIRLRRTHEGVNYFIRQGKLWGVISESGVWEVPCVSPELPSCIPVGLTFQYYWLVRHDYKYGVYNTEFGYDKETLNFVRKPRLVVPMEMNEVVAWSLQEDSYLLKVRKGEYYGLYSYDGVELLPPLYKEVTWLTHDELLLDDGQTIRLYNLKEVLTLGVATARSKEYKQVKGSERNTLLYLQKSGQLDIKKLTGFHKTLQGIDSIGNVASGDFVVYSQGKAALISVDRLDSMKVLIPYRYQDLYFEDYDVYAARKHTKW